MSEKLIRSLPVWQGAIDVEPLDGGITNLNYRVVDGDRQFAVRAGEDDPRLGIDRRNELACVRAAAAQGIAPELAHAADGVLVCAFVDSEALTPETGRDPDCIARVAELVRSVHASGPRVTGHLLYFSPFLVTRTYVAIAAEEGLALPCNAEELLVEITSLQQRIGPFVPTFCHNDLMPGNFLDAGDRMWLIDWEYGGFGHPYFDLAGFASNCEFDAEQDELLLRAYGLEPDRQGPEFRVMKAMAALRESLWAVIKGVDAQVDFDYGVYRDDNYRKYRDALAAL